MEIRQLTTFAMIVKLGSFTKAADMLGYSQSAITMQVKALEDEMGTPLFERFGRTIKLTREGESFFWYADQILKLAKEAKDISACEETPKGEIILGTPESLCLHCLPELIREYRVRYPDVEIKIRFGTCCELYDMLHKNFIDVAFFLDEPIADDNLVAEVLFDEPVVFIASPKHPLAQKSIVTPEDLNGQSFIITEPGCNYRSRFDDLINAERLRLCSTMEVSSVEIIKKFTKDNLGVTVLPQTTVQDDIGSKQLAVLPWAGPSFDVKVQLVHHKEKRISPALRAFIELTQTTLKRS